MSRKSDQAADSARVDLPCACATVRRAARVLTQLYDGHLRASEIEGTQFSLLALLDSTGPCSQAAIGERFALDKTTLSRNMKLLKNKGWIESTDAEDRRQRRYILTPAGEKRLKAARPAWRRAQEHLRSTMTEKDWDAMWNAFRTVTIAAQTAQHGIRARSMK